MLTWICDVCKTRRPDDKISVHTKTSPIEGTDSTIDMNIKYCNDKPKCVTGAKKVDYFKGKKQSKKQ